MIIRLLSAQQNACLKCGHWPQLQTKNESVLALSVLLSTTIRVITVARMLWIHEAQPQQILATVMTHVVVDKSTDNAKPHTICFFTTISTSKKMFFGPEKGIAWKIYARGVVWTLIDDSKLTNQIANLVAIVVKIELATIRRPKWVTCVSYGSAPFISN